LLLRTVRIIPPASYGKRLALLATLTALLLVLVAVPDAAAGTFLSRTSADGRAYKLFVPTSLDPAAPAPLVLMLHGCTQDPDGFAAGTRMNAVAETGRFLVVYPAQPLSANFNRCWNWFDPAHQRRGSGEPASLVGVVRSVAADHAVDPARVYVAGLSAGAAMAVILAASYPEVFAAVGEGSGLEYEAAGSVLTAFAAMSGGGPEPNGQGAKALAAMGGAARPVPVIVFHGTADTKVAPVNADQVVSQWAQTDDLASDGSDDGNIDDRAESTADGRVPGGRSFTHEVYADAATGLTWIERYLVTGMGHAWSGGSRAGSHTDPTGPDASATMWRFFTEHQLPTANQ
jgi:poly(hydroxyalkanoate) depolymerase family esterase